MNKTAKTTLKVIMWIFVAIIGLILLAILTLPLWIGPVVTGVANSVVPGIVKTDFRLNEFGLNQYSGSLHVGDMKLANPTNSNFTQENCVELDKFDLKLKPLSVFTKKIHIDDITLDGLLVVTTITADNFIQISKNASGESGKVEEGEGRLKIAESAGEAPEAAREPAKEEPAPAKKASHGEDGTHVVIDKLTLKNITVKIGMVPIPLPPIVLEGIGAEKEEGATLEDVWVAVITNVQKAMSAIGGALGDLGKGAISLGADTVNAAGDAVGAGEAVDAIGTGLGKTLDTATELGGGVLDAAGSGLEKTTDTIKDAGGAAIDMLKKIL